jgi:allantoin racemase
MKLAFQQVMGSEVGDKWVTNYNQVLRKNIDLVRSKDTEVVFQTLKRGINRFEAMYFSYLNLLEYREILEGIIQAEKDGFDAAMICCFFDPVLKEARQAVDIPVLGAAESSMLMATMMGAKFGVVTVSPEAAFDMEANVLKYGLSSRATSIRPINATSREQMHILADAHESIEAFKRVGRELIKEGAEILIPGCMVMAPGLRIAPGCEEFPDGLRDVDGVPVMDVVGTLVLIAEMMVRLKKSGSAWISRKGLFARPSDKVLKNILSTLPYEGPGVWRS